MANTLAVYMGISMNSKWQIHRVGLIDFWYYDEEEFYFLDGRMLLRGSNGSGKSVTMQSFIPLLLDGNMRPERLDPFGSRARKMENYLLEEDSEQEERTAYLFMEFKRVDNDTFTTVGIGLRGRKNKKLESWYFSITDGRRVGHDIFLYKDLGNKIVCTKGELRNRIGDGGRVMESQGEYAQCVNKLLFGFETMDEYREMLDLLIQLRTPKLSKDFKPSIINDILSNSLQTLTEDDLRPMSEAVENMDSLKTNLDTLKESVQAAKGIKKAYDQYNQMMLLDKARVFAKESAAYQDSLKKAKELERLISETREMLQNEQNHYQQLEQEELVCKEEKKSLDASDAVGLKEQEQKLSDDIHALEQKLLLKQKQEQEKKDRSIEVENRIRKQETDSQILQAEIIGYLGEMEDTLTDTSFDEYAFLKTELEGNIEEPYEFVGHIRLLKDYVEKVENGIRVLEQEKVCREKYDRCLQELEEYQKEQENVEKELLVYENQLHEVKGELTERIYQWERENTVLKVNALTMQDISKRIGEYQFGSDYAEVKEQVRSFVYEKEGEIHQVQREVEQRKSDIEEEQETINAELVEWQNQKDPEPPRSEQVCRNREELSKKGIPYLQFYKSIDFMESLTSKQAANLEEALLEMGILDAILVPEEYREQVLTLDEGMCDRYIFSDVSRVKGNLQTVFDVDNADNDILLYQKISKTLSAVGYSTQGQKQEGLEGVHTWLDENGHYKIGIMEGTITREYEAKYIGVRAREKYREQQIVDLTQQKEKLDKLKEEILLQLEFLLQKEKSLKEEWGGFPGDEDLKVAASGCAEKEHLRSNIYQSIKRQKLRLEEERKVWDEIRLEVQTVCAKTYLPVRLDVFHEVKSKLAEYRDMLMQLQIAHEKFLHGIHAGKTQKEYLEELEHDLDDIRYDTTQLGRNLQEVKLTIASVREQLKLTNYEEIKERLDHCIQRLYALPKEKEGSVKTSTNLEAEERVQKQRQEGNLIEQNQIAQRKHKTQKVFEAEYRLHYVAYTFIQTEDMEDQAKKVCAMLIEAFGAKKIQDISGSLQEAYHMNRGYLLEYHITMQSMFAELEEEINLPEQTIKRINITAKYRGMSLSFAELLNKLDADVEEQSRLLSDRDRELFEDILANTISKKIRGKIHASKRWVEKMNELMESMQTSSGLSLSLRWRNKRADNEEQLDTKMLVDLLQKDVEIMRIEEVEKVAAHFRSKIEEARKQLEDTNSVQSFHTIIREVLDYRKWFEFQLESQKKGEKRKELTDRVFFTFSGGEKAMAMYVPLFSAVVAKYAGARSDAPRMISLDEAFAGVDETNIKDMFRLMVEFEFNFMINSQILWGDYETVPSIAIYQLHRPENARFVSVIPHVWKGNNKRRVTRIGDEIEEAVNE